MKSRKARKNVATNVKRLLGVAAAGAITLLMKQQSASATPFTYQGATGTSWGLGTNWVGNTAPANGADLVFSAAGAITSVNATTSGNYLTSVGSITFNAGTGADIINASTASQALTITGAGIFNSSSNLQTISEVLAIASGDTATFYSGAVLNKNLVLSNTNSFVIGTSATLTLNSGLATNSLAMAGAFVIGSSSTVSKVGIGVVSIAGAATLQGNNLLSVSAGKLSLAAGFTEAGGSTVTVASGASLVSGTSSAIGNGTAIISGGVTSLNTGVFTFGTNNTVTVNGGTTNIGNSTASGIVGTVSSINVSSAGTLNWNGPLNLSLGSSLAEGGTLTSVGGATNLLGNNLLSVSAGTLNLAGGLTETGSGSTVTVTGGTLTSGGVINNSGWNTIYAAAAGPAGTLNLSGSLAVDNGSSLSALSGGGTATINAINVSGNNALTVSSGALTATTLSLSPSVNFSLNGAGGKINVGTALLNGNSSLLMDGASAATISTISVSGNNALTVSSGALTATTLSLSPSVNFSLNAAGGNITAGTVTLNSNSSLLLNGAGFGTNLSTALTFATGSQLIVQSGVNTLGAVTTGTGNGINVSGGTLNLANNSSPATVTFVGDTTISGGATISITANATGANTAFFGTHSNIISLAGGTITAVFAGVDIFDPIVVNSSSTIKGSGSIYKGALLDDGTGSSTGSTLTVDFASGVTFDPSTANTFAGTMLLQKSTGNPGVNFGNTASAVANAFGGTIVVNYTQAGTGTVALLNSNIMQTNSTFSVAAGPLNIGATSNTVSSLIIAGSAASVTGASGNLTVVNNANLQQGAYTATNLTGLAGANLTKTSASTASITGNLTGFGNGVTVSAGTLSLSGANSYTGATSIAGGMLLMGAQGAYSTNSSYSLTGGTLSTAGLNVPTLTVTGTGNGLVGGNLTNGLTINSNVGLAMTGTNTIAAGTNFVSAGTVSAAALVFTGTATGLTVNGGQMTVGGATGAMSNLLVSGGGSLNFTAAPAVLVTSGTVSIQSGTLQLVGSNTVLGSSSNVIAVGNAGATSSSQTATFNLVSPVGAFTYNNPISFVQSTSGGLATVNIIANTTITDAGGNISGGGVNSLISISGTGSFKYNGTDSNFGGTIKDDAIFIDGEPTHFNSASEIIVGSSVATSASVLSITGGVGSFSLGAGQRLAGYGSLIYNSSNNPTLGPGSTLIAGFQSTASNLSGGIGILSAAGATNATLLISGSTVNKTSLAFTLGGASGAAATSTSSEVAVTGNLAMNAAGGGAVYNFNLSDNAGANGQGTMGPGVYQLFTYSGTYSGATGSALNSISNLNFFGSTGSGYRPKVFASVAQVAANKDIELTVSSISYIAEHIDSDTSGTTGRPDSGTIALQSSTPTPTATNVNYYGRTDVNGSSGAQKATIVVDRSSVASTFNTPQIFLFQFEGDGSSANNAGGYHYGAVASTDPNQSSDATALAALETDLASLGYTYQDYAGNGNGTADGLNTALSLNSQYDLAIEMNTTKAEQFSYMDFDFSSYNGGITTFNVAAVPEPASLSLVALGAMGLLGRRRSRKSRKMKMASI